MAVTGLSAYDFVLLALAKIGSGKIIQTTMKAFTESFMEEQAQPKPDAGQARRLVADALKQLRSEGKIQFPYGDQGVSTRSGFDKPLYIIYRG